MSRSYERAGVFLVSSLSASPVYAASSDIATAIAPIAPLFFILFIAYLTRRVSIGGWLFYYYFNLFGAFVFIVFIGSTILDLNPKGWEDTTLYILNVISSVPIFLTKILETIFAIRLLIPSQRNSKNVRVLRHVLLASVVSYFIAVAIDYYYFPDNVVFSLIGLAGASIWTLYFFVSYRVKYAFSNWSGAWDYETFKERKPLP